MSCCVSVTGSERSRSCVMLTMVPRLTRGLVGGTASWFFLFTKMHGMTTQGARAVGIANIAADGTVLDTWYPQPALGHPQASGTRRLSATDLSPRLLSLVRIDEGRMVEQVAVETTIADLSAPVIDAHDAYLRLHLLSHRLVFPGTVNLEGLMEALALVVWTNKGPCQPDNFEFVRTTLRSRGLIHVYGIEKIPRMLDYVVPAGVRIAEAERVRLGAYLAEGTLVLREGYVSFNAGTYGATRIEGRLTSGVTVGENSTMALGSSAISPTDNEDLRPIQYVGRNCWVGENTSVIGVSIGDNCRIDAGLTLTPTTLIRFPDSDTARPLGPVLDQGWAISRELGNEVLQATR